MASTRRWLLPTGLVALALIGALAWVTGPARRASPAAELSREAVGAASESADFGVSDAPTSERAAALRVSKATGELPAEAPAGDAARVAGETWAMWGHVLRVSDGAPAVEHRVLFGEREECRSDARGRFEIELDLTRFPRGSRRVVRVLHGNGAIVANEECTLEPGLELRVEDQLVELRGRLVDAAGEAIVGEGVSIARLDADGVGPHVGHSGRFDDQGRFHVAAARSATGPEPHRVWVWFRGTNYPFLVPANELQSEEGATLTLDLCPLRFEIRASDGGALVEPELRVVAWRRGAERAEVRSVLLLDENGATEMLLERDVSAVEIAAGAEGCASWIEERPSADCGGTWRVQLARLRPDDVVEGLVLAADGRPVPGAHASGSPPTRDDEWVAVPAIRVTLTDAEGRFSLPFARGQWVNVRAWHFDHGSTDELLVQGGQRDVVLRFSAAARVDVNVTAPGGASLGAAPTRFALALVDGSRRFDWGAFGRMYFEEVPAGSHRLLCLSADGDLWGLFELEVFDTAPVEVRRALAPARWVEGVLVDAAGEALAGVDVRRLDAPLDPGEEWNPYLVTSDAGGRFRVLLGSDAEAELAFVRDGTELGRARLAAGDAGKVRVDEND